MLIKSKIAIEKMRVAGKILARVLEDVKSQIKPGVSTFELDAFIERNMRQKGLVPECKGYAGYQHATCISLNDVIVHGVPSKDVILKSGDFAKIDVVGSYKGYCVDMTRYFFVGDVSPVVKKMASVAQAALDAAVCYAVHGNKVSDISFSVQQIVEKEGYSVIRAFAGHGIGKKLHEEPEIPNYGRPGEGMVLLEGMTLAIEPMIAERGFQVRVAHDGWTAKTEDGGLAAHVEDTVLVGRHSAEVLTRA